MENELYERALNLEALMPLAIQSLFQTSADPMAQMPLAQLKILRALFSGQSTTTALAHRFGMSAPAVSQLVRRLVAAGLVCQEKGAGDARVKFLRLTPECQKLMEARSRARASQAVGVLARLSHSEVATLMRLLQVCAGPSIGDSVAS